MLFLALLPSLVFSLDCGIGETCYEESLLLQTISSIALFPDALWSADAFGDCIKCNKTALKFRSMQCVSVYDDTPQRPAACALSKLPRNSTNCSCGLEICKLASKSECAEIEQNQTSTAEAEYESVGCFASDIADREARGIEDKNIPHRDMNCLGFSENSKCMHGLAFFRVANSSVTSCFEFCLRNGLDIFGLTESNVCRCGATKHNHQVWHSDSPNSALVFDPRTLELSSHEKCELEVYRYTGHFEAKGVPSVFTDIKIGDIAYMDSIARGKKLGEEVEEDGTLNPGAAPGSKLQRNSREYPSCWPNRCSAGKPWPIRALAPPQGVEDNWQDYVIIPYKFNDGLDTVRKDAFRTAASTWNINTCISFVEIGEIPAPPNEKSYVQVGIFQQGSCWSHLGYVGPSSVNELNLGWCSDERHIGNMMHELGHTLGMGHTQQRPDATSSVSNHGPFLTIHWENIHDGWKPQYQQNPNAYMGSGNDGPGDPRIGWAPYDFSSIMHYPAGAKFDTIPTSEGLNTGNRQHLRSGDIRQINDMYQCKAKGATTTPTPSPTPAPTKATTTPTPSPTPAPSPAPTPLPTPLPTPTPQRQPYFVTQLPCGVDDNGCATSGNFPAKYSASESCVVTVHDNEDNIPFSSTLSSFATEYYWDTLTINGNKYSGTALPSGIIPQGNMIWQSDTSIQKAGWKLCFD